MEHTGFPNSAVGVGAHGLETLRTVHWNHRPSSLCEMALARGEGQLSADGALVVRTGSHTGRAAQDKAIVKDAQTEDTVWWSGVRAMTPDQFNALHADMLAYAQGREMFVQDLFAGAHPAHRLAIRVYTARAWHSLFIQNLLIEPTAGERAAFQPECVIVHMPGFRADPERHGTRTGTVIASDFTRKIVLIGGTAYAGEIKKSVFTLLSYCLPPAGVMPMHCSVNVGGAAETAAADAGGSGGENAAVFFGLSGTGKTTLSADPARMLIGDDEHGWGADGLFNFEGGCYAKVIRLSAAAEPDIYAAAHRFATVLENTALDPQTRVLDLDDAALTENTRAAYPLSFIPNARASGRAGHPRHVIMLTADAFGVLPPLARLTPSQAMYHFLSGYTAKIAGTEQGITEPRATFSACFGAPFMPRHPGEYGALLGKMIARHGVSCWLVNTGWTGGAYGTGRRMPIRVTRALLDAVLRDELQDAPMRTDPSFGLAVPTQVDGVDARLLDPRRTWADGAAYDAQAQRLVGMFAENFKIYADHVDAAVRAAAAGARQAAE